MSIRNHIRYYYERDCRKHELADDAEQFATDRINALTNDELLVEIDFALEERLVALASALEIKLLLS